MSKGKITINLTRVPMLQRGSLLVDCTGVRIIFQPAEPCVLTRSMGTRDKSSNEYELV